MFEYLGAGKAVIGAVRGEPAEILRAAGALVVEPGDESAIAAAVRQLAGNRSRRDEMGRQGRRYVERHFDRRVLSGRYRQILAGAAGEARPLVTVPRRNEASVTTASP
jgi:glycosyltransferase involved in cell wall biosynthesis